MKSVAYWTPVDEPEKSNTLIYILQHPSREAAAANWKSFQDDPEWKSVHEKSEANGKLVEKLESTFLTLTDFSRDWLKRTTGKKPWILPRGRKPRRRGLSNGHVHNLAKHTALVALIVFVAFSPSPCSGAEPGAKCHSRGREPGTG